MSYKISNGLLYVEGHFIAGYELSIHDGHIVGIYPSGSRQEKSLDVGGSYVIPGMIDIHIHGAAGYDTIQPDPRGLPTIARAVAQHGVTGFLPTAMTASVKEMAGMIRRSLLPTHGGAVILGCHLEGPFLSKEKAGAQNPEYILPPSEEAFRRLTGGHSEQLRIMTLDPSAPGALPFIEAHHRELTLSAGHTCADFEAADKAFRAGLRHITHGYNAMPSLHHRAPGLLGAALSRPGVTVELIADLIHIHPSMLRLAYLAKGKHEICLVTDSIMVTGLPDGIYASGGYTIHSRHGEARLEDGTLAGSTLTLDRALRNMVEVVRVPVEDAVLMVTANPARECGEHRRGYIRPGYAADLTVLDRDLQVKGCIIGGRNIL